MNTLDELQRRAKRESDQHKAQLRGSYGYARSLGFTPAEAKILSGWSIERINSLAYPDRESNKEINPG